MIFPFSISQHFSMHTTDHPTRTRAAMTTEQAFFAVFCVEALADKLGVTGDKVYTMLADDSDILDAYIVSCYDALHTQGGEYIVGELQDQMQKRGVQNHNLINDEQSLSLLRFGRAMIANRTLIGHKCANVIKSYAACADIPLREAFDIFYRSNLYLEIRHGISDMHCRSDGYLAEELQIEVNRENKGNLFSS